jgi:hypothetical protein
MADDNGIAAILQAFGVGNKSAKTDRGFQLDSLGDLRDLASTEKSSGADAEGASQAYFTKLLSGNPTAVASAVAPTTNAVASQQAARGREESAMGTSRTGGTNAGNQQTADKVSEATQTAINSAVPGAASNLANLGTTLLGQAGSDASSLGGLADSAHQYDQNRSDKQLDAITKLLSLKPSGGSSPQSAIGSDPAGQVGSGPGPNLAGMNPLGSDAPIDISAFAGA